MSQCVLRPRYGFWRGEEVCGKLNAVTTVKYDMLFLEIGLPIFRKDGESMQKNQRCNCPVWLKTLSQAMLSDRCGQVQPYFFIRSGMKKKERFIEQGRFSELIGRQ